MLRLFTELPLRLVFSEVEWGVEKGAASEVPEVRVVDTWHVALNSGYVEPSVAVGSGQCGDRPSRARWWRAVDPRVGKSHGHEPGTPARVP